jgi:undecaprenyl-diphosphatase
MQVLFIDRTEESEYKLLERINISIFSAINKYAGKSPLVDNIAIAIAEYLPLVFIAVLICLWFSSKVDGKHAALYAGYSAVLGALINFFITIFYIHPRPFMENIGTTLINHAPNSSFPSDHTTFLLSIATMLLFFKSTKIIGCSLLFFGLFGGVSRVFCGIHFPLDIFGSLLVSFLTAAMIWAFRENLIAINEYTVNVYMKALDRKKA